MNADDFFCIGKILRTFGSKGHLIILFSTNDPLDYHNLESVFIGIDHDYIPFIISELEEKLGDTALVLFEDIGNSEEATEYAGCSLYLPVTLLPARKGKNFDHHAVTGYSVFDEVQGNVGILQAILQLPQQELMQVMKEEKEILIPLVEEILIRIDRKKKILYIHAPEGLIDLYL